MFIIIYLSTDYHQRDKFNLDKRYSAEEKVDKNKKFESRRKFRKSQRVKWTGSILIRACLKFWETDFPDNKFPVSAPSCHH